MLSTLTQLGVNDISAIQDGNLIGASQFFGTSTTEIVSTSLSGTSGSWNRDRSETVTDSRPWSVYSSQSPNATASGVFAFHYQSGTTNGVISHRTILSGY